MPPAPPLPLTSLNRASPGAVVWRHKGQLSLTAVVKATFSLVSEGRMTLADPDPIAADELPDLSGRGLRAAGDLAPYLGHVNVSLTGHIEVPPNYTEPVVRAWLAVVQNGVSRIDKRLELDASIRAGEQRRQVPIRGLDPISRHWPVRRNLLGDLDPRRLEARIMELPEAFDWRYFQTVPADQRLPMIAGDEWIVLGGMLLRRPRLRTQLPAARGVARLYRRDAAAPREGEAIALHADMIQIDVDRLRCSIVWRGHARLQPDDALERLFLVGAVETQSQAVEWVDPFSRTSLFPPALRGSQRPPPNAPAEKDDGSTAMLAEDDATAMLANDGSTAMLAEGNAISMTLGLSPELANRAAAAPAMPFSQSGSRRPSGVFPAAPPSPSLPPPWSPSSLPPSPSTPASTPPNAETETVFLLVHGDGRMPAAAVTPFENRSTPGAAAAPPRSAPPPAPRSTPPPAPRPAPLATPPPLPAVVPPPDENPIGSTIGLLGFQQAELAKGPATPFEGRPVAPAPRPQPRRAPTPMPAPSPLAAPTAGTPALVQGMAAPAPIEPAPPPRLDVSVPVPVIGSPASPTVAALSQEEIAEWPPGLGAEFLMAMAEVGTLGA